MTQRYVISHPELGIMITFNYNVLFANNVPQEVLREAPEAFSFVDTFNTEKAAKEFIDSFWNFESQENPFVITPVKADAGNLASERECIIAGLEPWTPITVH